MKCNRIVVARNGGTTINHNAGESAKPASISLNLLPASGISSGPRQIVLPVMEFATFLPRQWRELVQLQDEREAVEGEAATVVQMIARGCIARKRFVHCPVCLEMTDATLSTSVAQCQHKLCIDCAVRCSFEQGKCPVCRRIAMPARHQADQGRVLACDIEGRPIHAASRPTTHPRAESMIQQQHRPEQARVGVRRAATEPVLPPTMLAVEGEMRMLQTQLSDVIASQHRAPLEREASELGASSNARRERRDSHSLVLGLAERGRLRKAFGQRLSIAADVVTGSPSARPSYDVRGGQPPGVYEHEDVIMHGYPMREDSDVARRRRMRPAREASERARSVTI